MPWAGSLAGAYNVSLCFAVRNRPDGRIRRPYQRVRDASGSHLTKMTAKPSQITAAVGNLVEKVTVSFHYSYNFVTLVDFSAV